MTKKKPTIHAKQQLIDLRLGIKLKDVFWPFDNLTLADILSNLGYDNIQQSPDQRTIIAEKKQIRFYLDQPKLVFGFHADTSESIITSQKEFFATMNKAISNRLEEHVRFYEIEYKAKQFSEKNTFDTELGLYRDSTDIDTIQQTIGLPIKPHGINVIKEEGTPENDSWYQIEITPQTSSSPNTFVCRLLHRDPSSQTVYNSMKKSNKVFGDLALFLESKV